MMQTYLPDIDPAFRTTLKQFNRITDLEPQHLYLRDINQAYNKIDTFVTKQASIYAENGQEVLQSQGNIIDLSTLAT
jgi:predicted HNH restriction endonuclease